LPGLRAPPDGLEARARYFARPRLIAASSARKRLGGGDALSGVKSSPSLEEEGENADSP